MDGTEAQKNTGADQTGATQEVKSTASEGNKGTPTTPTTFTQEQLEKEAEKRVSAALAKAGRENKALEAREAAIKAREDAANATQHEIDCFNISKEYKLDPAELKAAAGELGLTTPEQLTALAKRLGGMGAGTTFIRPDSGRNVGGAGEPTAEQLEKMSVDEYKDWRKKHK
jgi:hypothetical protein